MNDLSKSKLEALANDKAMIDAIVELLSERIERENPVIYKEDNNELLGEKFRAYEKTKELIGFFIDDIETYKQRDNLNPFNKEK